ncbi:MAG: FtsX-like permease family protein [Luteitalea sp.]|nr:FtsX-like permease family protein [Luteitalea sp.]
MSDLRLAVRLLLKHRGYTAVATLTLALAVGGTTAIFSVIYGVMLRPLPYAEPERLVVLRDAWMPRFPEFSVAPGRFVEWQRRTRAFESIAAMQNGFVSLTGRGEPERLRVAGVSKELFGTLGVRPSLGRTFTAEEDRSDGPAVAILSYSLWQSRFAGDPAILGTTVALDDRPTTIVGIMPPSFGFPSRETQLWRPLALSPEARQVYGGHYLGAVARLKPDVTLDRAREDMDRISRELETVDEANEGWTVVVSGMHEYMVRGVRTALYVLAGAVGFVLLIACANIANLLLARGTARQRELAVRASLGASRGRLVRQLLVEQLMLGLAGGACGLLLAWGLLRVLIATAPDVLPRATQIGLDGTMLGFALFVSLVSPIVFGLIPSLQISRTDLRHALVLGGRSGASSLGRGTRHALIVSEVALAVLLLVGSGLLLRSFVRLVAVDPGFEPSQTLVAAISLPELRYPEPKRARFFDDLARRAAEAPGVQAAGLSHALPFVGDHVAGLIVEGTDPNNADEAPTTNFYAVTPGYFAAMGIPLVRGRGVAVTDDADSPRVAVVSQSVATKVFGGRSPIGRRIRVTQGSDEWREIVGIVGDVKQYGLNQQTTLQVYEPAAQHPYFSDMSLVVRSSADPALLAGQIRSLVRQVDPALPIASTTTMAATVATSVGTERLTLRLLGVFALVAMLMAAVGLYGMLSYAVGQRTQEIGIRIAHGARPRDIFRLILGQGVGLTLAGIILGLIGAMSLTSLMASLLFDVGPRDPLALVAAPAILFLIAIVATAVPARRAMRIDPIVALRQE